MEWRKREKEKRERKIKESEYQTLVGARSTPRASISISIFFLLFTRNKKKPLPFLLLFLFFYSSLLSSPPLFLPFHSYALALSPRLATAARTSSTASSTEEAEEEEEPVALPSVTDAYRRATAKAGGTIASRSLASSSSRGAPSASPHDRRARASLARATWSAGEALGRGPSPRSSLRAAVRAWSKRSTSISMSWLVVDFLFWVRFLRSL